MLSNPYTLCDGWGWYVDTENMKQSSASMQVDTTYHHQRRKRARFLKYHLNSLEVIREDPEVVLNDEENENNNKHTYRKGEKVLVRACSTAVIVVIVVSLVLFLS